MRYYAGRILCRLGLHNVTCRGRVDHHPHVGDWRLDRSPFWKRTLSS